jgi:hypothetical protein
VLQHLVNLPETDNLNIGVQSSSFGIITASGALARHPNNPAVKFFLEWEGPADRWDTPLVPHDPYDNPWWAEREAAGFMTNFGGYYLRMQSEVDHRQTNNDHAIKLVNRATHTRHGGAGRCVWTRVNSASGVTANPANAVYPFAAPPDWIAESVPTETMLEQYLLELAAMPPLGPTLTCPPSVTALASTRAGATVSFTVTATDPWDPSPTVTCSPASGSLFPIGTTTVTCCATDASSNANSCSFPVRVVEVIATPVAEGLTLRWDVPDAILEEGESPTGAWITVPEASPLTVPTTDPAKFYRLRYIEGPRISKVEPSITLENAPSEIYVFGLNFESTHRVRINGVLLTDQTMVEPNVLRIRGGTLPAGVYDVELVDGAGTVLATQAGGLEVAPAPALRAELPPSVGVQPGAAGNEGVIQLANGECKFTVEDLRIPGRGLDFVWQRAYRSRLGSDTPQGTGWDHNFNFYVERQGSDLVLHNGRGRADLFRRQADGTYACEGLACVLVEELDGSFKLAVNAPGRGKSLSWGGPVRCHMLQFAS